VAAAPPHPFRRLLNQVLVVLYLDRLLPVRRHALVVRHLGHLLPVLGHGLVACSGKRIGRAERTQGRSDQPDQSTPVHASEVALDL